ncbi:MAG: sulfur oxidation c-type cytochrome SoxX [Burkholderiales bacterium]|nr:sulfur oxidation c-type cytochrome SoxX [Burkholderiales bacterium]
MKNSNHLRISLSENAERMGAVGVTLLALAGCAAPARPNAPASPPDAITTPGDPSRGRDVVMGRDGNCLLCHAIPETGARFMGDLGPPLAGAGARLSAAQLRMRLIDPQRSNPDTIMPAYARIDGLTRVGKAWRGKPILGAQQIEDVVAYLGTLR